MRWRSFFAAMASISFPADGLIRILYAATLPEAANERFKGNASFAFAVVKRGQVFGVFGQRYTNRFVDHI